MKIPMFDKCDDCDSEATYILKSQDIDRSFEINLCDKCYQGREDKFIDKYIDSPPAPAAE